MSRTLHPLAAEARPIGLRELGWLMASLAVVLLPHALRAPAWLVVLALCLYAWRVYLALNRAPLPSRWLILGVAVVAMLGIWMEGRSLFGRTPGILLLILLSGLKLLETRTHRDAVIAAFLGYFLIVTNFLFTQSIPTAAAMCGALFMLTSALVGFSAPQRPLRANLRTSSLLLAHAAPAALVLFLLFPRVQGPLWGLPQDAYAGISGLSDNMAPGNLSRLVLSDAIAFRAEFEGEPPPSRQLYWRGPVMWDFDGRTWRMGRSMLARYTPPDSGTRYRYSIVLEPHNREWLFALESASVAPVHSTFTSDGRLVTNQPVRARLRYQVESVIAPATRPDETPSQLARARHLPAGVNPRARELGERWRDSSPDDASIVDKGLAFMGAGRYIYSLEPPLLGENSVDDFLFKTREGFCEHFSSAFVFLMRAAGVPARVVMGYQGGEVNPVDRIVTVRQSDAHAWAEVFMKGQGWVRIDPTAASAPRRVDDGLARSLQQHAEALPYLMRTDIEWLRSLRYRWEAATYKWNVWVLGYNPDRQRDLLSFVGIPDADWRALTATLFTVLGLITAGLLAWSLRGLARSDPVQAAWRAFCSKLAARGLERAPHEGPRDFSTRAARALPTSRRAILRIASLYIALRYGGRTGAARLKSGAAELRRLVRELRLT
jgi:transglutaminase-like putative cysteine protease